MVSWHTFCTESNCLPQPLTIKPNHLSQCLLSPACISHGVALQLRTSSFLPLRPERCLDHTYLFTDFSASHSVLTRPTHPDRSGVQRGSPEGRAQPNDTVARRSGETRRRVSEETSWRVGLRLWRLSGRRREGLHLTSPGAASQRGNESGC